MGGRVSGMTSDESGRAWVNKKQRFFISYEIITYGKQKDKIMLTLANGDKAIVSQDAIVQWPKKLDQELAELREIIKEIA